ncbi:TadE/TadG family type IV pilus assembly protein [Trinickia mobilis]|uniref:TadE/TadG family type IV pilus assembly protein n=1 Tax=Trinickia mobilis TaxID=2816356 RepID=UPI001A90055D|nr:TadE/TadG family type IV pilus assembly protein [Trinickia mobilis]
MRGAAAVEFALMLILLVPLALGVAEFGHAISQYETLTKGTRDAARYLSTYLPSDPAYPLAQAQCLVMYGSATCPTGNATPLVTGLTTSMVVVCDAVNTTNCQDATDPTLFASVPTYDSNNGAPGGAQSGSINVVEVKIKGFKYQPIEPFFNPTLNLAQLIFNDIFTVMRQVS